MRRLMSCLVLAGVVAVVGCSSSDDNSNPPPDVAGTWTMVANVVYGFDLTITQSGGAIDGTMVRTNGVEPTDTISGTIDGDGMISFIRSRVDQQYNGILTSDATQWILEGTFGGVGNTNVYPWRATMAK